MNGNCSCGKSNTKNKSGHNLTSSAEEGCNKDKVQNPKSATNNQW